jgi:hypothetical protein
LTGAIILIALGGALLLNNLGMVQVDWWGLLRFWPVLLILIGLDVLLGHRSAVGSVLLAMFGLALVVGIIFVAGIQQRGLAVAGGRSVTRDFAQPLDGAEALDVLLNLGATETDVRPLEGGENAVEGRYTTDERLAIRVDYGVSGGTGHLEISQNNESFGMNAGSPFVGQLDLSLTDAVPIDLAVDAGVGDVSVDLTGLQLASLVVDAGVGNVEIVLPETGRFDVTVNAGVGNVEITLPDGLEASVSYDGGLSALNVSTDRLAQTGEGVWRTSGYEGADSRATISIDAGIGNVTVND